MSEQDFSGVDERLGRDWGLTGGVLFVIGSVIGLGLLAVSVLILVGLSGD